MTDNLVDFGYFRQTRSKRVFSPWSGNPVAAAIPFDAENALSKAVDSFLSSSLTDESPLSSPPTTPPSSPPPQSKSLDPPPISPPPPPILPPKSKRQRNKEYSRRKREAKRAQSFADNGHKFYEQRPKIQATYFNTYATAQSSIQVDFNAEHATSARTGFVGLRRNFSRKTYSLDELLKETGFKVVEWDGLKPTPIVDSEQRILVLLAGQPNCENEEDWEEMCREACELMEMARASARFPKGSSNHRRGNYYPLTFGISHGGGQRNPGPLEQEPVNAEIFERLNSSRPFRRMANFASAVLKTWQPSLYDYYVDRLGRLYARSDFKRMFTGSIFPAATYNTGPQTATYVHTDAANLPFGMCSVTALGTYNPKRSGHLILWDLGLVVEFPPGATILLPSAVIAHGNVRVQKKGERRYSFTQWAAGGLFRWAEHEFKKDADFFAGLTPEEYEEERTKSEQRWKQGLDLFSTVKDIEPTM
ncbi:hypothetical protein H0H93_014502 [Arthromyces matolae]|nr:hypothetical protein H0H93_014502 [Arthromyces matolae]